ncbi:MAG: TldD/PmbA family protein [Bacillota bacterium]
MTAGTNHEEITNWLVETAISLGAGEAEAYTIGSQELSIEVSNQEIETIKISENTGVGVRIVQEGRIGFAYNSSLSRQSLLEMLERAVANAKQATPDPYNTLPQEGNCQQVDIFDPDLSHVSLEEKINFAMEIEKRVRSFDSRIKVVENCTYQDTYFRVSLSNSKGISGSYQGTYCGAFANVVAEQDGDNQTGFGFQYAHKFKDLNPVLVGQEAAFRAVRMLGATSTSTRKSIVVLEPYIAASFLGIIGQSLSSEAVQKGRSLFAKKIKTKVASPLVNVIDDGTLAEGIFTAPFDAEGVPTRRTNLITEGVLQGYLYNTYTAARDGVVSTGNSVRYSFKGLPQVGTTNIFISPGEMPESQLIRELDKGLYITEIMGLHTANPITGDFSVGAAGLLIENGELTKPFRGVAIAGNMMELFELIDGIGNNLRFFGGKGSPTIRVSRLAVSGS